MLQINFPINQKPLNKKCLFQSSIKIESDGIIEYNGQSISTYFIDDGVKDFEAEEVELIYRNVQSYGVGHNCSVKWSSDHKIVETTFLPETRYQRCNK